MSSVVGNESWIPEDLRGKSKTALSNTDKKRYNQAKRKFLGDEEYLRRKEAHTRRRSNNSGATAGGGGDDEEDDDQGGESSAPSAAVAAGPWVSTFIFIEEGKGLAPKDRNGLSDPYVVITCPGSKFKAKTSVIYKTLDPVWQEKVAIPRELTPQGFVHFECFDKDKAGRDDFEGQFDLDITNLPVGESVRIVSTLIGRGKKKEEVTGTITVSILKSSDGIDAKGGSSASAVASPSAAAAAAGQDEGDAQAEGDADDDQPDEGEPEWLSTILTLEGGAGLAPKDKNGLSDPYCKVICSGSGFKAKTSVQKKTLNPTWNQRVMFPREYTPDGTIRVEVWDRDKTGRDDFEGQFEINVAGLLLDMPASHVTVPLSGRGRKGEVISGSITYSVVKSSSPVTAKTPVFSGTVEDDAGADRDVDGDEDDDEPEAAEVEAGPAALPVWHSTVLLIESASGLAPKDKNGLSDPYVKVLCPGSSVKARTPVQKKTLSPVWSYKIVLPKSATPLDMVHLEVWDRDRAGSDDFEGQCNLSLADVPVDRMVRRKIPLMDRGKKNEIVTGFVVVSFWKSSEEPDADAPIGAAEDDGADAEGDADDDAEEGTEAAAAAAPAAAQRSPTAAGNVWRSTLVSVIAATALEPKDKNGLSDPYCVLVASGSPLKIKTSVKKKTLNPIWNEKFAIAREQTPHGVLRIEVWDKDKAGRDDFEGQADVQIENFAIGVSSERTLALVGRGKKGEKVSGTVTISVLKSVTALPPSAGKKGAIALAAVADEEDVDGDADDDEPEDGETAAAPAPAPAASPDDDWHSTVVTVESGSDLAPKDKNGLSDPYVRISCPGGKFKAKTSTQKKTLNPVWNERVVIKRKDSPQDLIHVEVWDRDRTGRDDFEGQCDIDLRDFALGARERKPFQLQGRGKKGEKVTGFVTLSILRTAEEPAATAETNDADEPDPEVEGDADDDAEDEQLAPPTPARENEELARMRAERDAALREATDMHAKLMATELEAKEVPREAMAEIARLRAELAEERRLRAMMPDPNAFAALQRELRTVDAKLAQTQQRLAETEQQVVEEQERTERAKRRAKIAQEVLAAAVGDETFGQE